MARADLFPQGAASAEIHASMAPYEVRDIHNQAVRLDLYAQPLIPKGVAVNELGINGDILATFTLPNYADDLEPAKQIAIVDYGEFDTQKPPPVFLFENQPVIYHGRAMSRYGLFGLNYTPESHLATYTPLLEGSLTVGRADTDENYRLGLRPAREPGNEMISRKHLALTMRNHWLTITDHSAHGTRLTLPKQEQTPQDSLAEHFAGVVALFDTRK